MIRYIFTCDLIVGYSVFELHREVYAPSEIDNELSELLLMPIDWGCYQLSDVKNYKYTKA